MLTRSFIHMPSKKLSDDSEIINEFKKKYHMKCHVTPQTGEEDDVDFKGPITPQTVDNMKVVKYTIIST